MEIRKISNKIGENLFFTLSIILRSLVYLIVTTTFIVMFATKFKENFSRKTPLKLFSIATITREFEVVTPEFKFAETVPVRSIKHIDVFVIVTT